MLKELLLVEKEFLKGFFLSPKSEISKYHFRNALKAFTSFPVIIAVLFVVFLQLMDWIVLLDYLSLRDRLYAGPNAPRAVYSGTGWSFACCAYDSMYSLIIPIILISAIAILFMGKEISRDERRLLEKKNYNQLTSLGCFIRNITVLFFCLWGTLFLVFVYIRWPNFEWMGLNICYCNFLEIILIISIPLLIIILCGWVHQVLMAVVIKKSIFKRKWGKLIIVLTIMGMHYLVIVACTSIEYHQEGYLYSSKLLNFLLPNRLILFLFNFMDEKLNHYFPLFFVSVVSICIFVLVFAHPVLLLTIKKLNEAKKGLKYMDSRIKGTLRVP